MSDVKATVSMNADVDNGHVSFVFSCRFMLAIIGFFIFLHLYAQRIGMSVAVVCMLNQTALDQLESVHSANVTELAWSRRNGTEWSVNVTVSSSAESQCSRQLTDGSAVHKDGPFVWQKDIQGHILGAFFYGYLISQVPGGMLAERYGGKWVLTVFVCLSTASTLLTPVAARLGFVLLIVLRICCGIGSGGMFPAMHAMLGQWTPPMERSKLCGITYAGGMMGNVLALPLCGFLCEYGFDGGWGSIFYVIGISSIVTLAFWILFTSNTPSTNRHISACERNYIINSLKGQISEEAPKLSEMPWLKIFTSGSVWAIIVANFCTDWGLYTYLTSIPTFYKEVLFFDIQSNGLYSALPFVGMWAIMNLCPLAADKLRSTAVMSTATVRKLFNSIGSFGPSLLLIGLSFLDCTQTALAVTLLTVAVSLSGCVFCGYFVNHMDIAPQYAGTLMGISNGIAASSGFIAPYVASVLTRDQMRESWHNVFYVTAAVYTFGAITYCLLASGSIQPWAVESAALHASDTNVIEVELDGTDTLIDTEKRGLSSVARPASEQYRNDDVSADSLLEASS